MIAKNYNTTFTNERMVWYDEYAELDDTASLNGHLQQASAELSESLGLTFTKAYVVWCGLNTAVEVGDQITADSTTYIVRAIKDLLVGNNKHKQLYVETI
jgi:hypothetical protein